jgi:hypothetical protein
MPNRSYVPRRLPVAMALLVIAAGGSGCLPSIDNIDDGPLDSAFAVSDVYTPSGFMGDGATFKHLYMDVNKGCAPRPAGAQGYCYKFTYYKDTTPTGVSWAGVFWVFPANNWGTRPGHAIDTTKFHQIRYYAAVDLPKPLPEFAGMGLAGEPPNFFYGNIMGFQNVDDIGDKIYPKATDQLTQYHMPFPGANQVKANDSLIGGFGWSIAFPSWADPSSPLTIYVDDIVWDTADPPATGTP